MRRMIRFLIRLGASLGSAGGGGSGSGVDNLLLDDDRSNLLLEDGGVLKLEA